MLRIIKFFRKIFYKVCSCFYVGATDILPEPLSKEEEDNLVKLKENGDVRGDRRNGNELPDKHNKPDLLIATVPVYPFSLTSFVEMQIPQFPDIVAIVA